MSEQGKSVTVTTTGTPGQVTHPDAGRIEVEDGHLYVKEDRGASSPRTVAIYAPGHWRDATAKR